MLSRRDAEKAEQRKKRQLEKAANSSMLRFIRKEMSDRPEVRRVRAAAAANARAQERRTSDVREQQAEDEQALEEFEEEHFVRVPLSKKERSQMKRRRIEGDADLLNVRRCRAHTAPHASAGLGGLWRSGHAGPRQGEGGAQVHRDCLALQAAASHRRRRR